MKEIWHKKLAISFMFWEAQNQPKLIDIPTILILVPIVHYLLILQVILAISLYIACNLTAFAKYLQLAYSRAGNLRDFTYNLHVNVLLIV